MKKIIAFLLVFSLAFMLMAPLASAAGYERLPIIYIRGNGAALYDAEGKKERCHPKFLYLANCWLKSVQHIDKKK